MISTETSKNQLEQRQQKDAWGYKWTVLQNGFTPVSIWKRREEEKRPPSHQYSFIAVIIIPS